MTTIFKQEILFVYILRLKLVLYCVCITSLEAKCNSLCKMPKYLCTYKYFYVYFLMFYVKLCFYEKLNGAFIVRMLDEAQNQMLDFCHTD